MAKQYRLGEDDNVLEAYGVSFTLINSTHYLDTKRIALLEQDILLGRLIPTGAPDIDDTAVNLPPVDQYIINKPSTGGGGSGEICEADEILYTTAADGGIQNIRQALDKLFYVAPKINSFTNNVGIVEKGQTITSVTLNWNLNKTPTIQTIDGTAVDVSLRTQTLDGLTLMADKSYALSVGDGQNTANSSTSVTFRNRRIYGVSTNDTLNNANLNSMTYDYNNGRGQNRTFNCSGHYMYFAYPASYGTASFLVNGLSSTAWVESEQTYTNPSGYSELYKIYRSTYVQNGSGIAVTVQ